MPREAQRPRRSGARAIVHTCRIMQRGWGPSVRRASRGPNAEGRVDGPPGDEGGRARERSCWPTGSGARGGAAWALDRRARSAEHWGPQFLLTEEIELGPPDEPRRCAARAGRVAHAAHERGRDRAVLLHHETG